MDMSFAEFDFGFRKLCLTFGVQYNENRASAYYEHLKHRLDGIIWRQTVHKIISTHDGFPRVSMLIKTINEGRLDTKFEFNPKAWIDEDCRVRECVDGIFNFEKNNYSVAFRCPRCKRADVSSDMAVYKGAVTLYSDAEMESRRRMREFTHNNPEYRNKTRQELFREAAKIFSTGLKGKHEKDADPQGQGRNHDLRDDHHETDSGISGEKEGLRMEE